MCKSKKEVFILISPVATANNFIRKSNEEDIPITPLKMQKLVYFLYKNYLQTTDEKLFSERFETWKYGPVVPSIYAEFSSYKHNPIKNYGQDSQGKCYAVKEVGIFKTCFDKVWERYKNYSAEQLSNLTHSVGTAWSKAKDNKQQYLNDEDIKSEPELS